MYYKTYKLLFRITSLNSALNNKQNASVSGTWSNVDIHTYTSSSNSYTCPTDGYILVKCPYAAGITQVYLGVSGDAVQTCWPHGYTGDTYYSIYVRKGMKVYITLGGNCSVYFRGVI